MDLGKLWREPISERLNLVLFGVLALVVYWRYCSSSAGTAIEASYPNAPPFISTGRLGNNVTCDFRVTAYGGLAKSGAPQAEAVREDNPLIVSFSDLDAERPTMKGTVGDERLRKTRDDGDVVVLAEVTTAGNVVVYSLSRNKRTAVFSKAYMMAGLNGASPLGMTSVGRCW